MDLASKYRPQTVDEVVGQSQAAAVVNKWIKTKSIPHTIMFSGPSGVGKTTLARILINHLDCSKVDVKEINIADSRGIDTAREIRTRASSKPIGGKSRVWILDEFHQATKDCQNALLKVLEEPPSHVYYFICTTEPAKLLKTIQTRCTEIKLKLVSDKDIADLVNTAWRKENASSFKQHEEVTHRIVEVADGSPRKALKILESVISLKNSDEMLDAVQSSESREFGINLARCLMDYKKRWTDAASILKNMEDDPETVRQIVMSYCTTILLGSKHEKVSKRAAWIVNCLREPIYSAPRQLLALSIYEIYHLSS